MADPLPPTDRLNRAERFLAASSFSLLALGAVLIWVSWKHRVEGASLANVARMIGAVFAISLSVQGTRLRHRAMRSAMEDASTSPTTHQQRNRSKR